MNNEADLIALKEITFLPTPDVTTIVNLYKAGESCETDVRVLPQMLIPAANPPRLWQIIHIS